MLQQQRFPFDLRKEVLHVGRLVQGASFFTLSAGSRCTRSCYVLAQTTHPAALPWAAHNPLIPLISRPLHIQQVYLSPCRTAGKEVGLRGAPKVTTVDEASAAEAGTEDAAWAEAAAVGAGAGPTLTE